MKITDYCPRAAPFDTYLVGKDLVGVEVGVDVGAHAEAMLTYRPVALLHLIDPWPDKRALGRCEGRLWRFGPRFEIHEVGSLDGAKLLTGHAIDFVYIDQVHDNGAIVTADLKAWWPLVKAGGVLGYRNYDEGRGAPLDRAVENFVAENKIRTKFERYLNDIILFR